VQYQVEHKTSYEYAASASVSHNLLHLRVPTLKRQRVDEFKLDISPKPRSTVTRTDYFGNQVHYFSLSEPHEGMVVTATSHVWVAKTDFPEISIPWEEVVDQAKNLEYPLEILQFTYPSRHVRIFPAIQEYAKAAFTKGRPVLEATKELTSRIYNDYKYDSGATNIQTPLEEVVEKRHGVCQDFAHVGIGVLRSLGLPARYVSGYLRTLPPPGKPRLVGADASHAWFSVFGGLDIGWIDFDPTNDAVVSTDHITLAFGRDFEDVSPVQGVVVGGQSTSMAVGVDVMPIEKDSDKEAAPKAN